MANVKKRSISLTPDLDSVVERWIASGRYASRSEVIRAALRALEREEEERTGKPAAFAAEIVRRIAAAQSGTLRTLLDDPAARLRKDDPTSGKPHGVVLRELTEEERAARARALAEGKKAGRRKRQ